SKNTVPTKKIAAKRCRVRRMGWLIVDRTIPWRSAKASASDCRSPAVLLRRTALGASWLLDGICHGWGSRHAAYSVSYPGGVPGGGRAGGLRADRLRAPTTDRAAVP